MSFGSGYGLGGEECLEVAEFVIATSARCNRELDMRMLHHGISARIQAEEGEAYGCWRDIVASTIQGTPVLVEGRRHVGIRVRQRDDHLAVARDICELAPQERLRIWQQRTGLGRAALYRCLANLGDLGSREFAGSLQHG